MTEVTVICQCHVVFVILTRALSNLHVVLKVDGNCAKKQVLTDMCNMLDIAVYIGPKGYDTFLFFTERNFMLSCIAQLFPDIINIKQIFPGSGNNHQLLKPWSDEKKYLLVTSVQLSQLCQLV